MFVRKTTRATRGRSGKKHKVVEGSFLTPCVVFHRRLAGAPLRADVKNLGESDFKSAGFSLPPPSMSSFTGLIDSIHHSSPIVTRNRSSQLGPSHQRKEQESELS